MHSRSKYSHSNYSFYRKYSSYRSFTSKNTLRFTGSNVLMSEFHIWLKIEYWVTNPYTKHTHTHSISIIFLFRVVYLLLCVSFCRSFQVYPRNSRLHSWKLEFLVTLGEAMPFFLSFSKFLLLLFSSHTVKWQCQSDVNFIYYAIYASVYI